MSIHWSPPDRELVCVVGREPTGGRIICELTLRGPQHTSWRVRITGNLQTFPGIVLYDATGYVTYPKRRYRQIEQAREVAARLLPFLLADAESYRRTMGAVPPADGWIFNNQVALWAYLNDTELANLADELQNPPRGHAHPTPRSGSGRGAR